MVETYAKRFANKVALVTGAGSGIGRATAIRFALEGASIAAVDINFARAKQTVTEILENGAQAIAIEADVCSKQECANMVGESVRRFEKLDIVFANAGINGGDSVVAMEEDQWNHILETNLGGVFLTCKYAIPELIKSKKGSIVTMASSMAGWDTSENGAAYMASKSGVVGLTKSLALQLARYQIRVNAVCPGIIKTRLGHKMGQTEQELTSQLTRFAQRIPLRRVGLPEDVAAAVVFLSSEDARHITGSSLLIDGGQTLQSWSNAPDYDAYPWEVDLPID